MDEVILQKIDSLVRCVLRLQTKAPFSLEKLKKDIDLQDIVIINLERLVQISVDIAMRVVSKRNFQPAPATMSQAFEALGRNGVLPEDLATRLQKAVGFRNLCVHEYDKINWEIVLTILTKHLDDYRQFGKITSQIAKE
ncbi:MAG: DUF86 domain-containing protein [Deltaproteobacteria bacterium]|nr:DUF86 domain-containing protein [Deltaproteobacteria bacterium]MBI3295401.1 DUF86 domain-containing protein [Deltaproteobacteria bacterium]